MLIDADLWSRRPRMLAAGLGFTNIIGVPGVLAGAEAGIRRITSVEIPASGSYSAFHNPGGPGNAPTPDVPYTSPGPAQRQPVLHALRDPLTVTFVRP